MDPAWASIIIGIGGSLITAASIYAALRVWMARREEREKTLERRMDGVEGDIEVQSLGLQRLDTRVAVLEDRSPHHRPPLDFAR